MKYLLKMLVVLCAAFVVYMIVWQRVQVLRLGYEFSKYEQRESVLSEEHRILWLKASKLKSVKRVKPLREDMFGAELKVVELEVAR